MTLSRTGTEILTEMQLPPDPLSPLFSNSGPSKEGSLMKRWG